MSSAEYDQADASFDVVDFASERRAAMKLQPCKDAPRFSLAGRPGLRPSKPESALDPSGSAPGVARPGRGGEAEQHAHNSGKAFAAKPGGPSIGSIPSS